MSLFGYAIITWLLLSKFITNKCFDAVFLFSYINYQTVMYIPRREKTFFFQLFSLYLVSGKAMKNPSTRHAIQPCEAFFKNIHDSKIRDCGEEVLKKTYNFIKHTIKFGYDQKCINIAYLSFVCQDKFGPLNPFLFPLQLPLLSTDYRTLKIKDNTRIIQFTKL